MSDTDEVRHCPGATGENAEPAVCRSPRCQRPGANSAGFCCHGCAAHTRFGHTLLHGGRCEKTNPGVEETADPLRERIAAAVYGHPRADDQIDAVMGVVEGEHGDGKCVPYAAYLEMCGGYTEAEAEAGAAKARVQELENATPGGQDERSPLYERIAAAALTVPIRLGPATIRNAQAGHTVTRLSGREADHIAHVVMDELANRVDTPKDGFDPRTEVEAHTGDTEQIIAAWEADQADWRARVEELEQATGE